MSRPKPSSSRTWQFSRKGSPIVNDEEFGLRIADVVSAPRHFENEAQDAVDAAAEAEADLMAHVQAAAADELPQPVFGDALTDASIDDIPMGGLPTPEPLTTPEP